MERADPIPLIGTDSRIGVSSAGHALFAVILIWLGVLGLARGDFVPMWQPVPRWVPARLPLAYLCAVISLATGAGMLWRPTAALAARVIFATFAVWLLVLRLPNLFFETPLVLVAWTFGSTAVMTAAAWLLCVRLAGAGGARIARALFGVTLIPFGLAHFMYLDATTVLIPHWLPWPAAWAYATGATFIAGGLAVAVGIKGRLAATLVTLQLLLFSVIVWVPRALAGTLTPFQRGEFVSTWALTAGAWVIMDSYGDHGVLRDSSRRG
jgi:uncharacterized membrane protein